MTFCFRMRCRGATRRISTADRTASPRSTSRCGATSYRLLAERDEWISRDAAADALGVARSVAAFHLDKLADAGVARGALRAHHRPHRARAPAARPSSTDRPTTRSTASVPERRYDLAGIAAGRRRSPSRPRTGAPVDRRASTPPRPRRAAASAQPSAPRRGRRPTTTRQRGAGRRARPPRLRARDRDGARSLSPTARSTALAEQHRDARVRDEPRLPRRRARRRGRRRLGSTARLDPDPRSLLRPHRGRLRPGGANLPSARSSERPGPGPVPERGADGGTSSRSL